MIMIITGYAFEDKNNNYIETFLSNGRKAIKQFPYLFNILSDFPEFSKKDYDSNFFLVCASTSIYDPFKSGPNKESFERLQRYEKLLVDIKIETFKKGAKSDVIKKMNSFDKQQNKSIILEFEVLIKLKNNAHIRKIDYNNFSDSNHDYRVYFDKIQLNLELTSLGESKPNRIIRNSFNKVAHELLDYIPDKKRLILYFKSDMLLDANSEMNEKHIFELCFQSIKSIFPIIFIKDNSYCSIYLNFNGKNGTLLDIRDTYSFYNDLGERLFLLSQDKQNGEAYLKKTSLATFTDLPISKFGFFDSKDKLVEIQTESVFPSKAESLREKAILNQLGKSVSSKLRKNQLANQKNSILVIQFSDLLFRGYSSGSEIFLNNGIEKIKSKINDVFCQEPNSDSILGVILTEDSLSSSIFIRSPYAVIKPDVLSKIQLISQIIT